MNPCNGEDVILTRTGHEVISQTINGNTFHLDIHFNPLGLSGLGVSTGAKYSVPDSANFSINLAKGTTQTQGENFRMIGQGNAPNFVLHVPFHVIHEYRSST